MENLMSGKRSLVSISIPVLNESGNIEALYARLDALATKMKDRCDLEFVFSDNHSDDNTWKMLADLAAKDPRVKGRSEVAGCFPATESSALFKKRCMSKFAQFSSFFQLFRPLQSPLQ